MKQALKISCVSLTVATAIAGAGFTPLFHNLPTVSTAEAEVKADVPTEPVLSPLKSEQVTGTTKAKDEHYIGALDKDPDSVAMTAKPKPKPKPKPKKEKVVAESTHTSPDTKTKDESAEPNHLSFNTDGLTPEQIKWITEAATLSEQKIPAAFFRAIGEQESNLRPDVFANDRNGGTWGIWQINEYLVGQYYDGGNFQTDRNNNGTPDVQEPMIAAKIASAYFDDLYLQIKQMRKDYPDEQWVKDMSLLESVAIAHNAGPTGMRKYPHFRTPEVTDKYLENMKKNIPLYSVD